MTKKIVLIGAAVVLALVGVYLVGVYKQGSLPVGDGSLVNNVNPIFTNGLRAGNLATQIFDSLGKLVGNVISDSDNAIPSVTGTSTATLTAAQICGGNTILNVSFKTATGTLTLPTAANILANTHCLKNNGDRLEFAVRNASSSGEFVIVGAASSTLSSMNLASSTDTTTRTGTTTIQAQLTGFLRGYKITSSTDWIIWQYNSYR